MLNERLRNECPRRAQRFVRNRRYRHSGSLDWRAGERPRRGVVHIRPPMKTARAMRYKPSRRRLRSRTTDAEQTRNRPQAVGYDRQLWDVPFGSRALREPDRSCRSATRCLARNPRARGIRRAWRSWIFPQFIALGSLSRMPASDVELRLCGSDGGAPWPYSIHWLLGFSALAGFAHAQPYTVNIAADETGAGTFTTPALNESGTIVQGLGIGSAQRFQAWPRVGPATTFLDTSGVLAGFTSLAPIPFNNAGRVAFRARSTPVSRA